MAIIRFPDDMVGIPTPVDDDKVLISDSEDAKAAKWWNLLSIRTWLTNYFPNLDASNVLTTDLDAWQSQLDIAVLKGSISDATITDIRTIDENGFYATGASSSNLPATNKVGVLKVVISGTDKHLYYSTDVLNLLEQWTLVYNGSWGVWVKVTKPSVLWSPDGTAQVIQTDNSERVGVGVSPSYKLDISEDLAAYTVRIRNVNTGGSGLLLLATDGTTTSQFLIVAADKDSNNKFLVRSDGQVTSVSTLTGTDFILSSDKKLKSEIDKIPVPSIDGLKVRSFIIGGNLQYGLIAQETIKTHPELVVGTSKKIDGKIDYYGIKQNSINAMLIKEVQGLKAKLC